MSYPVRTFLEVVEEYMEHHISSMPETRRKIMEHCRQLGIADQIPENWKADGTLKAVPDELPPMRERLPHEAG